MWQLSARSCWRPTGGVWDKGIKAGKLTTPGCNDLILFSTVSGTPYCRRRKSSRESSTSSRCRSSWPSMRWMWATCIRSMLCLLLRSAQNSIKTISRFFSPWPNWPNVPFSRPLKWWRTLKSSLLSWNSNSWTVTFKDSTKSGYD